MIITKRDIWTRQPPRPVRLDSSYLRARAVGACFSGSPSDALGNALETPSQGVAIRQMDPGSSYGYFPTDSFSSYSANLGQVSLSSEYTLAFQLSGLYYGSDHAILFAGQSGVGGLYVSFTGGYNGSGLATPTFSVTHFTVADYTLGSLGIKPAEKLCTIVITGKANSEAVLYCNGSRISSVAIGGLAAYSGQASYGALGGNNFRGGSSFALASPVALTEKEAIDLTLNPWRIFEPRSRHVFVGASGGGDVSLALSGSFETFASGSLSPQVTVALSGNSLTSAQGSIGPGIGKTLSGSVESFAAGTLSGAIQLAISGNALTFAFGTLTVSSGYAATLTGLEQTFFSGNLAPGIELGLSGNASSLAYGTLTVGAAYIVALTGLAQTISSGTLSPGIELSINGQAQTVAFGLFSPEIQTELTGRSMILTPGTLSIAGGSGGIGSLDPATIAAIAAAIWSDPRAPTIAKLLAIKDG